MNLAQTWRHALCDAALLHGPEAPTLCDGWAVRDLMAHLAVRDARPDALASKAIAATASYEEKVRAKVAAGPFDALVDRVRSGPPRLSPLSVSSLDDAVNTTEFLIHHEDIVRAGGPVHATSPTATEIDAATARAAWKSLVRAGRLLYRRTPVGLVVVAPGVGRSAVCRPPAGSGTVVLTGEPVELLLHSFGRVAVATVTTEGDPADLAAFARSIGNEEEDGWPIGPQ